MTEKKAKITIEKIFNNKITSKKTGKEYDKFTLMCQKGGVGFSGWGQGEKYHEGDTVEIEYDEESKYQGKTSIFFNLIQPKKPDETIALLKRILEKVEKIEGVVCEEPMKPPVELYENEPKDEIPIVNDSNEPK